MTKYPRIKQLGLTIITDDPDSIPGIKFDDLRNKLGDKFGLFCEFFGVQTCGTNGAYVYDVEAVLERMFSGKLTGTQLHWD